MSYKIGNCVIKPIKELGQSLGSINEFNNDENNDNRVMNNTSISYEGINNSHKSILLSLYGQDNHYKGSNWEVNQRQEERQECRR